MISLSVELSKIRRNMYSSNWKPSLPKVNYKWDGLKRLRNQFTPAFTKFKDADGNHVPFKNYPQKDAEYLPDVHSMETLFC